MTDAEAIEALNDFIDNPDAHDREEQRGAARSALVFRGRGSVERVEIKGVVIA